jgi:hypothetical protein
MQRISCLLEHERSENKVVGKVPVGLGFERLAVLVDASAVGETDCDGGIELYVVSDVLALCGPCSGGEKEKYVRTFACSFSFSMIVATESFIRMTSRTSFWS